MPSESVKRHTADHPTFQQRSSSHRFQNVFDTSILAPKQNRSELMQGALSFPVPACGSKHFPAMLCHRKLDTTILYQRFRLKLCRVLPLPTFIIKPSMVVQWLCLNRIPPAASGMRNLHTSPRRIRNIALTQ